MEFRTDFPDARYGAPGATADQVDEHFDFKMHQKSLTELNYDGNETRGRNWRSDPGVGWGAWDLDV